jgi:pyruvate-formate lyase-activating enzyme
VPQDDWTTLFVFTAVSSAGEGAVLVRGEDTSVMTPLMTTNAEDLEAMKEIAQSIADDSGVEVVLYRYTQREKEESFVPGPPEMTPTTLH